MSEDSGMAKSSWWHYLGCILAVGAILYNTISYFVSVRNGVNSIVYCIPLLILAFVLSVFAWRKESGQRIGTVGITISAIGLAWVIFFSLCIAGECFILTLSPNAPRYMDLDIISFLAL